MQAERRRSSADKVQLYRQRRQQEKLAATKLQAVVRGMQAVAAWKSAMEQAQPSRRPPSPAKPAALSQRTQSTAPRKGAAATAKRQPKPSKQPAPKRTGLLQGVDVDEDSHLTVAEQLTGAIARGGFRVIDLFRDWDEDDSGTVSRAEFRKAMGEVGFHATADEIDRLFDSWDPDGSGHLELAELRRRLRRTGHDRQKAPPIRNIREEEAAARERAATRVQAHARGNRARRQHEERRAAAAAAADAAAVAERELVERRRVAAEAAEEAATLAAAAEASRVEADRIERLHGRVERVRLNFVHKFIRDDQHRLLQSVLLAWAAVRQKRLRIEEEAAAAAAAAEAAEAAAAAEAEVRAAALAAAEAAAKAKAEAEAEAAAAAEAEAAAVEERMAAAEAAAAEATQALVALTAEVGRLQSKLGATSELPPSPPARRAVAALPRQQRGEMAAPLGAPPSEGLTVTLELEELRRLFASPVRGSGGSGGGAMTSRECPDGQRLSFAQIERAVLARAEAEPPPTGTGTAHRPRARAASSPNARQMAREARREAEQALVSPPSDDIFTACCAPRRAPKETAGVKSTAARRKATVLPLL